MLISDPGPEKRRCIPVPEKICIILLALCPILQHYKGLFVNAAVTVLLLVFPYALFRIFKKGAVALNKTGFVLPLVLFFFFKVVDHGTSVTELGQAVIFSVLVISVGLGCFDTDYFIRVIVVISVLASCCIILQYLCYYLLHFHVQMVPTSLFLTRSSQWILAAKTGRASVTGRPTRFYRPSAFFLEPSHMFIFMFIPLILMLLPSTPKSKERRIAVLLTIGMFFCTSGMGILSSLGIWGIFLGRNLRNQIWFAPGKLFRRNTLLVLLALMSTLIVMFFCVPFFNNSIVRIFSSGTNYTNAVTGRVAKGSEALGDLHGIQYIFGIADSMGIEYNMSGFNATMYRYGIVGVVLSYLFYLHGIFRLRRQYFWISTVIIALSFFSSHTHSTMFMIYCTFVFVDAYNQKKRRERRLREYLSSPSVYGNTDLELYITGAGQVSLWSPTDR